MQIVIDIPAKVNEIILNTSFVVNPEIMMKQTVKEIEQEKAICSLIDALRDGILLPKGHGKLIDAREYENSIRKHYFDNATVIRCTEIALGNAETIIEADKAGE